MNDYIYACKKKENNETHKILEKKTKIPSYSCVYERFE